MASADGAADRADLPAGAGSRDVTAAAGGTNEAVLRRRAIPLALGLGPAVAIALALGILLVATVARDPATGVTFSTSPFTDEGFNALNARNLALFGRWSMDGWSLHLVNLPFSVLLAGVFEALGVGIVQARLLAIAMVVATVLLLGIGLRRPFGRWPAALAALAYATSTLVLYYARLVYLEDVVALGLVAGALTLVRLEDRPVRRGLLGGLCFAVAIAVKPSALFAVAGLLGILLLLEAPRSPAARRWIAAAGLTIAALGAIWAVVIWLPNRDAVAADLKIWAPIGWPRTLGDAYHRVSFYLRGIQDDGAIAASVPLIVLAGLGAGALLARVRRLTSDQRRLGLAAVGWFAVGLAVLLVASYRPNRYVVPLLPALAILAAVAAAVVGGAVVARIPRPALAAAGVVVAILVAAPGLAAEASWVRSTGSSLPSTQAQLASLVPAGAVVVGTDGPILLMPAHVTTIVPRDGVPGNDGDLYATRGARWYLARPGGPPEVVPVPAAAWAQRQERACLSWPTPICLYSVP